MVSKWQTCRSPEDWELAFWLPAHPTPHPLLLPLLHRPKLDPNTFPSRRKGLGQHITFSLFLSFTSDYCIFSALCSEL